MRFNAEPLPRRRRGGKGWETLTRVLHEARLVGQAIALRGLSRFAVLRAADRRQKAIVCPTGHGAESASCGWVSGEKTQNRGDDRIGIQRWRGWRRTRRRLPSCARMDRPEAYSYVDRKSTRLNS